MMSINFWTRNNENESAKYNMNRMADDESYDFLIPELWINVRNSIRLYFDKILRLIYSILTFAVLHLIIVT